MKKYKKIHASKKAADDHFAKIKRRKGRVLKTYTESGKVILSYSFPTKK